MQPKLRFKGFTDEWEQRKLGNLMEIGSVKRIHMNEWKNTGVPFFRARDIVAKFNNKKIADPIYISEKTYNSNILKSGKVKKGQLLITGVGTIGIPYLITDDSPLYFKDGNVIWLKNNNYDGNFIFYFFTTNLFKNYLFKITGTGTVGTYTIENAKKTPISIPQINEQIRIGKLFNILENLLTLYERKVKLLTQIKKYLLDNLFAEKDYPNLRFKGFTDEWKQCKLEKLFSERKERSTKGILLSVTLTKGVIKTTDLDKKINSNVITGNYKVVKKNDIPYNSMRMWQGASGISNYEGIVSPAYTVLVPNSGINSRFYSIAFKRKSSLNLFTKFSQGLTSDTWNLKYPLIKNIKMPYTSLKEQIQITCLFEKFDKLIDLYEQNLSHLKELKKYLLQNMFC